jgi:hypothetical protein
MRKINGSSNYLRNQVGKNLANAFLCLALFSLIFIASIFMVFSTLRLNILDEVGLLVSLVPLAAFYFFLRKYRIYSGGWEGEKQVTKLLDDRLNDDFILINGLCLNNGEGDIDHLVLGPRGIFVLETKNWSEQITCNGDIWQRLNKRNFKSSPSRQVKRNTDRIKRIINSSIFLGSLGIWIEGIVVFTHNHTTLHLNNPTVTIIKLPHLFNYVANHGGPISYTRQQLEAITKEILNQKN